MHSMGLYLNFSSQYLLKITFYKNQTKVGSIIILYFLFLILLKK